jgi:hypothetical protein
MGKHRTALTAAIFGLAANSFAVEPVQTKGLSSFSQTNLTRVVDVAANLLHML